MNSIWIVVVVAAVLLVAGITWAVSRKGKGKDGDKVEGREPAAPALEKRAEPEVPVAVVAPPKAAPAPPPAREARPVAARAPMPPPAPVAVPPPPESITLIMAPRPRPAAPPFEHALALQIASVADWGGARALALNPAYLATIAGAVPATLADGRQADGAFFGLSFAPGAALRVARGETACLRALAEANEGVVAASGHWLASGAATTIAATVLAALAGEHFLETLNGEVQDLKNAIPAKAVSPADGKAKTLVQELSRFTREARENYASALGKPAFRERVGEACTRAAEFWRELAARADAARQQLEALAAVPRFGEVQVEKSLEQLRELQDTQRLQHVAARVLAALHTLRTSFGDAAPAAEGDALQSAAATLQSGADLDRDLVQRLRVCEQGARGDPYVGRSEFEAKRVAVRKTLDKLGGDAPPPGLDRITAAQAAAAAGFPGIAEAAEQWFLRVTPAGVAGVRRAPQMLAS
ncbi:MAG: hypothetical protein ABJA61_03060 [Caldimonas sp.]